MLPREHRALSDELGQVRDRGLKHPGERLTSQALYKLNTFDPPKLRFPQSLGPSSRFLLTSPGPSRRTVFPQSFQDLFETFVSSQKKKGRGKKYNLFLSALFNSRQAAPVPETPLLTKSGNRTAGGWSRSSRLPPSCVSPSHLAGLKHAGKNKRSGGKRRHPSSLCAARACARATRGRSPGSASGGGDQGLGLKSAAFAGEAGTGWVSPWSRGQEWFVPWYGFLAAFSAETLELCNVH